MDTKTSKRICNNSTQHQQLQHYGGHPEFGNDQHEKEGTNEGRKKARNEVKEQKMYLFSQLLASFFSPSPSPPLQMSPRSPRSLHIATQKLRNGISTLHQHTHTHTHTHTRIDAKIHMQTDRQAQRKTQWWRDAEALYTQSGNRNTKRPIHWYFGSDDDSAVVAVAAAGAVAAAVAVAVAVADVNDGFADGWWCCWCVAFAVTVVIQLQKTQSSPDSWFLFAIFLAVQFLPSFFFSSSLSFSLRPQSSLYQQMLYA